MANDYISRDYAVENMENFPWDTEHDRNAAIHLVRELVPAADVVEVVRCKDCIHNCGEGFVGGTISCGLSNLFTVGKDPMDFCSSGEKRTE